MKNKKFLDFDIFIGYGTRGQVEVVNKIVVSKNGKVIKQFKGFKAYENWKQKIEEKSQLEY